MKGAGVAVGGTVDKQIFSGLMPASSENIELRAC